MSQVVSHNIVISVYKESELEIINFHLETLSKINFKRNIIFNIVSNPDIYELSIATLKCPNNIILKHIKGVDSFFTPYDEGSYHHAANLSIAMHTITLNYNGIITFIDPDFIFICRNFSDVITDLHLKGNVIIGMHWDKTSTTKWRDFVAPHFFSINMKDILVDTISFYPLLDVSEKKRNIAASLKKIIISLQTTILKYPAAFTLVPLFTYLKMEISFDTLSYFRLLAKKFDIKIHLFRNQLNIHNYQDIMRVRKNFPVIFRNWLPELIGVIPRTDYNLTKSFIKEKYPKQYENMRPEEISYKNKLFGIHMRTVKNFHRDKSLESQQLLFLKTIYNDQTGFKI